MPSSAGTASRTVTGFEAPPTPAFDHATAITRSSPLKAGTSNVIVALPPLSFTGADTSDHRLRRHDGQARPANLVAALAHIACRALVGIEQAAIIVAQLDAQTTLAEEVV
jgi:hypothetical protein